jgi:hypothetical protein
LRRPEVDLYKFGHVAGETFCKAILTLDIVPHAVPANASLPAGVDKLFVKQKNDRRLVGAKEQADK